jgi:GT2 family glycosyltransferase
MAQTATTAAPAAIAFIIPVRNDRDRLRRCLGSIRHAAAGTAYETIVVDHSSTDDSASVARDFGASVLVRSHGNVASLRNDAAAHALAPLLAFVDADHEVGPGWVSAAIAAMEDPRIAAVGAPCHAPPDGTWVQRSYDSLRRHPPRPEPAEWFGAGNMVIRRNVFREIGGFDTTLESCEDVDLCFRMRSRGYALLHVPGLVNVHLGDPATLRRLFLSELWRGRDNLRVSMKAPWSLRNAASTAAPLVQLIAAFLIVLAVLSFTARGVWLAAAALAVAVVPVVVRVWMMRGNTAGAIPLVAAVAVAVTYDAGRALALIARARHHRRR